MKTIFFEWAEHEEQVYNEMPSKLETAEFSANKFSIDEARDYNAISVFIESEITAKDLEELPNLQIIAIRGAGYDHVDVEAAKAKGIKVYRVASYSPQSIAEHVFALLLSLTRRLNIQRQLHEQEKNQRGVESMGMLLQGKTLGLYGVGNIGQATADIAQGFGMQVKYYDKYVNNAPGLTPVDSLQQLFAESDIVSLHVPLTEETKYSVNAEVLNHAKDGLYLINTARGDVVVTDAVINALDYGKLAGLGVDVLDTGETDDRFDSRLLRPEVMQTHHVAFFTTEAVNSILEQTLENLKGKPQEANIL